MAPRRWIRASELQSYAYCARAWWLQQVLGLHPADQAALERGRRDHRRRGARLRRVTALSAVARLLLLVGLALLAVALLWRLCGG